jgi:RHS repeat-associated protein
VTIPTVQAESGGTAFDRGTETGAPGANAFDGVNVINGAELMTENGSLRFVVGLKALASGYDANGNMTLRLKDGARYFLGYDAESRLTSVSGTVSASFAYNGDGQRVTSTIGTTTTTYIGGYFEWQSGAGKSYYFAGAQRVAMRTGAGVEFLLGDHLGSTSLTVNSIGGNPRELRYYPWGGVRYTYGTTPTDYRFTGQQELSSIGLYNYGARFYDPQLGHFVSPDTIIPQQQGTQAWDRYAGMNNNPLRYTDPSGHGVDCGIGINCMKQQRYDRYLASAVIVRTAVPGGGGATTPSLATVIGDNTILTTAHGGHGALVGSNSVGSFQINGQDVLGSITVAYAAKLGEGSPYIQDVMTINLPDSFQLPIPAELASTETISSLTPGLSLSVVYYDDDHQVTAVGEFEIIDIANGIALLRDPGKLISRGDSGGSVYYGDVLVGNVTSMNTAMGTSIGSFNVTLNPPWVSEYYQD